MTKFQGKFASLQQVSSANSQDNFQICCADMYLVRFLANFAGFRMFLWISRDFTDLLEIRGSATAQNIRSPDWENKMYKRKRSIGRVQVSSLYFLYKPNQTKRYIWKVVANKKETFQRWNTPSWFKLVWSTFFFCRLNSLFQVEVFEAIQHILTSRAGWKFQSLSPYYKIRGNWIQSQTGINANVESQKWAIFC